MKTISVTGSLFSLFFFIIALWLTESFLLDSVKNVYSKGIVTDFKLFFIITGLSIITVNVYQDKIRTTSCKIKYLVFLKFSSSHFVLAVLTGFTVGFLWKCPLIVIISIATCFCNSCLAYLISRNADNVQLNEEKNDRQVNELNFPLSDAPVEINENLGTFNRALAGTIYTTIDNYVENDFISLALNGKWGSGKTSVINGVKEQLESNGYQVLSINFWRQKKAADVVMELERQLEEFFSPIYFGWRFKELEFFKLAAGLYNSHAGTMLSLFESISGNESLRTAKDKLEAKINEALSLSNKKRIIVIFDDIDRVFDKDDLLFYLKAIIYLVGFKKVVSLTTIDIDKVIKGLDREYKQRIFSRNHSNEGDTLLKAMSPTKQMDENKYSNQKFYEIDNQSNFIHKIFNVTFEMLNKNFQNELVDFISSYIKEDYYKKIGINNSKEIQRVISYINEGYLHGLLDNYREAKQLINEFYQKINSIRKCNPDIDEEAIGENISYVQILFMSILKVKHNRFYFALEKIILADSENSPVNFTKLEDVVKSIMIETTIESKDGYRIDYDLDYYLNTQTWFNMCRDNLNWNYNSEIFKFYFRPVFEAYQVTVMQIDKYINNKCNLTDIIKNLPNEYYCLENYRDVISKIKSKFVELEKLDKIFLELTGLFISEYLNKFLHQTEYRAATTISLLSLYNYRLTIDDVKENTHKRYRDFFNQNNSETLITNLIRLYSIAPEAFGQNISDINYYNLLYFYLNPFHAHTFGIPDLEAYNTNLTQITGAISNFYILNIETPRLSMASISFYLYVVNERLRKSHFGSYLVSKEQRMQNRIDILDDHIAMYREMLELIMTETLEFIKIVNDKPFQPDKTEYNKSFYRICDEGLNNLLKHSQFDNYRPFQQNNQQQVCNFIKLLLQAYPMPETVKTIGVFGEHFKRKLDTIDTKIVHKIANLDEYVNIFKLYLQQNQQAGEKETISYATADEKTFNTTLSVLQEVNVRIKAISGLQADKKEPIVHS